MKAILRTWDTRTAKKEDTIVEIDDNHNFADGPYADTIPFTVGSNQEILPALIPDIEEYTGDELKRAWDRLEKLKLTPYVEMKMDEIEAEMNKRAIRETQE